MIAGIGNEYVFILIRVEIVGLMKIICLGKSHIVWDKLRSKCW